jgi:hypothetical protein
MRSQSSSLPATSKRALGRASGELPFEAQLLLRVGLGLWLLASVACIWELLALQPPDSPLRVGVLSTPVAQLRNFAFALGSGALIVALLWRHLYAQGGGRAVALLLCSGAVLHAAVLCFTAARGLLAVQLLDPRPDARYALYTRAVAHALTTSALLALLLRRCSRAPVVVPET